MGLLSGCVDCYLTLRSGSQRALLSCVVPGVSGDCCNAIQKKYQFGIDAANADALSDVLATRAAGLCTEQDMEQFEKSECDASSAFRASCPRHCSAMPTKDSSCSGSVVITSGLACCCT